MFEKDNEGHHFVLFCLRTRFGPFGGRKIRKTEKIQKNANFSFLGPTDKDKVVALLTPSLP